MDALSLLSGCFAVAGQGRNARNAKSLRGALLLFPPPPAAPGFSVPLQEQDIRLSDVHSHTSCYQEKTLSQRLEWALINRVATGASSPGRGQSARSRWGMGRRAAVGWSRRSCWHSRVWR